MSDDTAPALTISVALAAYNGADYIKEQLDSLAAQTRLPDEIVISDDGSQDDTLAIVERFRAAHPDIPMTVLANTGAGGFNGNFLNAFAACRGALILPCDQDDVWMPEKIATMEAIFRADPTAMTAVHDLAYCDSALTPTGETKMGRVAKLSDLGFGYCTGMASAFRADFLALIGPPPGPWHYDLWPHHVAQFLRAKHNSKAVLAMYRRHDTNASSAAAMNRAQRLSRVDYLLSLVRWSMVSGETLAGTLNARHREFAAIQERLQAARSGLVALGIAEARIDTALEEIAAMLGAIRSRIDIRSKRARLLRVVPAVLLYARGGYANFKGAGAMAKDIVMRFDATGHQPDAKNADG